MGIEIDIVAGCSIGSLVGAAYACDRLSALEDWVTSFSYWDVLRLMDLSRQRGGLLRGERVFNQYREIMPETEIEKLFPSLRGCCHQFKYWARIMVY